MQKYLRNPSLIFLTAACFNLSLLASEATLPKDEARKEKLLELKKNKPLLVKKAAAAAKPKPEKAVSGPIEKTPETAGAIAAREKILNVADVEQLQKNLKTGNDLTVDFTQTIYRSLRKKTTSRQGKGYFNKPNKFRWSLLKPSQEDWIYNGNFLAHYLPDKKSIFKYQASAAKGKDLQHLIDMVLNFSTLLNHYQLLEAKQLEGKVRMQLKPKADGEIDSSEIVIDMTKNYVSEVKLNFRGGNHTLFTFTNPNNNEIKEALFELPKDIKIEEVL